MLRALSRLRRVDIHPIRTPASPVATAWLMLRRFPPGRDLPAPALLVGAGHATHVAMLAGRHARGGRIVVLMKPSLPTSLFDLCIVPEHDDVAPSSHVLVTRGVLNCMAPAPSKDPMHGLILIGGPSTHYRWDEDSLLGQLHEIVGRSGLHWTLTTSPRTPAETLRRLQMLATERLDVMPWQTTAGDWLPAQLASASQVWVSEDSVSMLYEALSARTACGLLAVPRRKAGRVSAGTDRLVAERLVTPFAAWKAGRPLCSPASGFDEAARCARWIATRWLAQR